jgi:Acyl-coenzyme A:6-aminopenicillanic acid acyl-transferase
MDHHAQGCFLIGVTGTGYSKTEEALIGSVSDDPYDVRTFVKGVRKKDTLAHIGTELISTTEHTLTERGYFARPGETTRGINEAGLAFTCAMVIENETLEKPPTTSAYADITEYMMNHCLTVNDAIELFTSKGPINPAYSVLLADAHGDLAHIEVGSYGTSVYHHYTKENPGAVFAVNCYLSQSLVNYNAPHTHITDTDNNNLARRERGQELAGQMKGELDVEALIRILSDHKNSERDPMKNPILEAWGYSICNHGTRKSNEYPHEDLPWGTVSAEILQPSKKQLWYAYGWPCGQKPEYGDQIFQEHSWGQFIPFGFTGKNPNEEVTLLTTPDGKITPEGKHHTTTK